MPAALRENQLVLMGVRRCVTKRWTRPEQGAANVNVDRAFSSDGRAGSGMILRNHTGDVIFAACRKLDYCYD